MNTLKNTQIIILPKLLTNSIYVKGLREPLEAVAEVLDLQDKHEYANALRDAATIVEVFTKINLENTAKLFLSK